MAVLDEIRVCPNCGAHVLAEGDLCPRCDHPLNPPALDVHEGTPPPASLPEADAPEQLAVDRPGDELQPIMVLDLDEAAPDDDASPPEADAVDGLDRADRPTTRLGSISPPDEPAAVRDDLGPEAAAGVTEIHSTEETAPDVERDTTEDIPEITVAPADQETMPDAALALPPAETALGPPPHPWLDELAAQDPGPPDEGYPFEPGETVPRLTGDLIQPTNEIDTASWHERDAAPPEHAPDEAATGVAGSAAMTHARPLIPPAPYTPPPVMAPTPPPMMPVIAPPPATVPPAPHVPPTSAYGYGPSPAMAYVQQRVQYYVRDHYQIITHTPHEVVVARGKSLSLGGWLVAIASVFGLAWYLLILLVSGFRKDRAYITLEADGRVYEDGPGAAHVRRARARSGRRWSVVGLMIFILAFLLLIVVVATASVVVSQDRYQAALREAHPTITLFEERFTAAEADPGDVDLMRTGLIVWSGAAVLALLGLGGGLALFVVGYIHATAYTVNVPPLPGYE